MITLKSGKKLHILGINEHLEPYSGYDSAIEVFDYTSEEVVMTADERAEIADVAIEWWQKFKLLSDEEVRRGAYKQ